jgi:hypothetical protein
MPIRRSDIDTTEIAPKLQHKPKARAIATLAWTQLSDLESVVQGVIA